MSFERVIVLPIRDNDGRSLSREIHAIKAEILALAGGFSEVQQVGIWLDNGKEYRDKSLRLSITLDTQADVKLRERLPEWCASLRQVCLYTHRTLVASSFVYPVAERVEVSA